MFGFSGAAIAPGTLEASAAYTGAVNSGGAPIPDPALQGTPSAGSYTGIGGRRRRKMKGGASQVSMGGVGYGYTGTGAGGLADATQYVKPGNSY